MDSGTACITESYQANRIWYSENTWLSFLYMAVSGIGMIAGILYGQKSNREFWHEKINGNKKNDKKVIRELHDMGYRICIVWECITRDQVLFPKAMRKLVKWLPGSRDFMEISI